MKKLLTLIVMVVVAWGFMGPGLAGSPFITAAQQAQPIPSANEDVRVVAGLLLAQELLAITPPGMVKLAAAPMPGWEAVGGTGLTPQARAAASSSGLACNEVLKAPATQEFQVTPTIRLKNPLRQPPGEPQENALWAVYKALAEAEAAGQMELAYTLACIYLINGPFNFFNRGVTIGFERIDNCLAGKDITLELIIGPSSRTEFPVECSKYTALRAMVAIAIASEAYSFFGPLASIGCQELVRRATNTQATLWARLAAARAYVQGVLGFPGVFQPCIHPPAGQSEGDAFLAAARQAKEKNHQELLEELMGLDYQFHNDAESPPIALYSSFISRRGLAKALEGAPMDKLEALAQDANNPEIGLAAYYELGNRWADKPEAELRQLMTEGATPAVRRAAIKALLTQLGRASDVQCLLSLANGQECK